MVPPRKLTHHVNMQCWSPEREISDKNVDTSKNVLIPRLLDQNPWAHWRSPIDMMRHGWGRNKSSAKSYAKTERMVNAMRRATSDQEAAKV